MGAIGDGNPIFVYCMTWNSLHLQYRFYFDMIMVTSWFCIFMNCVFYDLSCVVKCNPLHDSCNKIQLSFKNLVTESVSFHKFVLTVPLILNFVFHFMSYRSLMVMWVSYIFDYIPTQFLFWFYWIIFLKRFL